MGVKPFLEIRLCYQCQRIALGAVLLIDAYRSRSRKASFLGSQLRRRPSERQSRSLHVPSGEVCPECEAEALIPCESSPLALGCLF